eukprot:c20479_g1_i1 orf=254-1762(-)
MVWNLGSVVIAGVLTAAFFFLYRSKLSKASRNFPPGPPAIWPLIGHLPLLLHLPHQRLAEIAKHYGPILGLRLGCRPAVFVSSPALAREVLLTHDKTFAHRPPFQFYSILFYGSENDIVFGNYGPEWRKRRKICALELFSARRLHEFEYVRQEEMAALLQRLRDESKGGTRAVEIARCVGVMASNNITRMLFSKSLEDKVPGRDITIHDLLKPWEQECRPTLGDLVPCLKCFDFLRKRRMRQVHNQFDWLLEYIIQERKQYCSNGDLNIPHDFLQVLLSREEEQGAESLSTQEIKSILLDMITAGIHSSTLTLEWAMAQLLRHPRCLRRLEEELGELIGRGKQLNESHVSKLVYLKHVVKEVLRLHPPGPLLVPRMATEACKVGNYELAAGTQMYINVWAIGRDEQVWEEANEFHPERFENKEVDVKGQHFELLPFGSGRRACLGLPLGLSTLEVTLANLVNNFQWELPPGETCHSVDMLEKPRAALRKATPMLAIPKPLHL